MKRSFARKRIGLLGGGQLARMLALKGHELGLEIHVYSSDPSDPAAQVARHWHHGRLDDVDGLHEFFQQIDVATFESEFLNPELLDEVALRSQGQVLPSPNLMGELQDRLSQKKLLEKYKLPTSPYERVNNLDHARGVVQRFDHGTVLKRRRFGYDGKGTFVVKSLRAVEKIKSEIKSDKYGFIGEQMIPFKRELAILAARNPQDEVVFTPLVETQQKDSRCWWVKGPADHAKLKSLKKKISKFLKEVDYAGVIAFELFDHKGQLLVNEIAPRVHNSGHYSLNGLSEDQFTLHLKAIIGASLKRPQPLAKGFAMLNLLGESHKTPQWDLPTGVHLHWYGKTENRPGRKMGHLNCNQSSPKRALNQLFEAQKRFRL